METATPATELIQFKGRLTSADMRQTVPIFFDVPEGVTQIHCRYHYSPKHPEDQRMRHQISVMIFDPTGPRCEISIPTDEGIFINEAAASPGAMPGPIQAGRWRFFNLVHRLLADDPVEYEMTITLSFDPITTEPKGWTAGTVAPRGAGWYRGDLHAHTIHSDGSWDIPDLVNFWRERQVDFMTLSDHNTISGLAELHSLADDTLLTLGGCELSTYYGHAVAVGIDHWFDWRKIDGTVLTMPQLAQEVIDSGALLTIAHPMNQGDPICCGCRWDHFDMYPGNALAVEVWNGGWKEANQAALLLFYRWINEGHRLTAVSGTDMHGPPPGGARGAVNVVYAEALSQDGIIDALKAGRSYISAGPDLIVTVTTNTGHSAMIGDTLPAEAISGATVTVEWSNGYPDSGIRLLLNGWVYREKIIGESGKATWELPPHTRWVNAELRDAENGLWAVTNPIYFEA